MAKKTKQNNTSTKVEDVKVEDAVATTTGTKVEDQDLDTNTEVVKSDIALNEEAEAKEAQDLKDQEAKAEVERLAKLEESKNTVTTSKNLLTDSKASIAEKVEYCLTVATGKTRSIANVLQSYNDAMKPGVVLNEQLMVGKQYELLNLYRGIFSNEDYGTFKAQFDIVNLFFNHYVKEAFGAHYLFRFDYLWKWDAVELTTLLNVNEVICQLANYENRPIKLKQINLEYALNPSETIISGDARDNIIRYYSA